MVSSNVYILCDVYDAAYLDDIPVVKLMGHIEDVGNLSSLVVLVIFIISNVASRCLELIHGKTHLLSLYRSESLLFSLQTQMELIWELHW